MPGSPITRMAVIARRVATSSARGRDGLLVGGLGDEDDVDVADVVELAGAGLAHADDREARRLDLRGREAAGSGGLAVGTADRAAREMQCRIERRSGGSARPAATVSTAATASARVSPRSRSSRARGGIGRAAPSAGFGERRDRRVDGATASTSSAAAASAEGGRTGSSWAASSSGLRSRNSASPREPPSRRAARSSDAGSCRTPRIVSRVRSKSRCSSRRLVGVAGGGECAEQCLRLESGRVRQLAEQRRSRSRSSNPARGVRRA